MKLYLAIACFLFVSFVAAQENDSFPLLNENDLPSCKIELMEYYNGNSLWGLINGGADIYLEYGFDKLAFQQIDYNGENFRIEVYRMQNKTGAFGIFSVNRFKCEINDTLTKYICITQYQVQAAVGKYYISIANNTGTDEALKLTVEIFEKILSKTNESEMKLPPLFDNDYFTHNSDKLKFIVGELGLQNGFPMWYDMLAGYSGYEFFVIPIEKDGKRIYISQISFSEEADTRKLMHESGSGNNVIIKTISPKEIIFVKGDSIDEDLKRIIDLYR